MLLRVKVGKGQFSTEHSVQVKTKEGIVSFFLDKRLVVARRRSHYIEVGTVHRQEDFTLVELPCETLEDGDRFVSVPSKTLIRESRV